MNIRMEYKQKGGSTSFHLADSQSHRQSSHEEDEESFDSLIGERVTGLADNKTLQRKEASQIKPNSKLHLVKEEREKLEY
jgi:hypothetical protein